jgi:deferrochelatase/peroxidase EfeB
MIRRGTTYGPPLPEGVREDDGTDRGIVFVFIGAHITRQFEFVQTQWINQGLFIDATAEKDPICGPNDGTGIFTIPEQPIRRRLRGLPQFVVTRGGGYCFMPRPEGPAMAGRSPHVVRSWKPEPLLIIFCVL